VLAITFRSYRLADREACLAIFDDNCPEFFAPNERDDYLEFLAQNSGAYTIVTLGNAVVGAYGLLPHLGGLALRWILFSRATQGHGLGGRVMARVRDEMRDRRAAVLHIAASHKSAPFFARFGAREVQTIRDGWGPGMDRVDMQLTLTGNTS
jgi:GNAT superfamily N-acetyltransferase